MLLLLNPHESGRGFDDGDHDDDDDDRVYDHHHDGLALGDFVTPLFLSLQDFSRERERYSGRDNVIRDETKQR